MSSKLRVYEVARDLGMDAKELVARLQSMGVTEVKNHMSVVSSESVERLKRQLERKTEPKTVEERIRPTVVKRRSVAKPVESPPVSTEPEVRRPVSSVVSTVRTEAKLVPEPQVRRPPPQSEVAAPPPSAPLVSPQVVEEVELPPQVEASEAREVPPAPPVALEPVVEPVVEPPVPVAPPQSKPADDDAEVKIAAIEPTPEVVEIPLQPESAPVELAAPSTESPSPTVPEPNLVTEEASAPAVAEPATGADAPKKVVTPVGARPSAPPPAGRTSAAPRTGIEVWEGRPGVPMSQVHRGPVPRRVQYDAKAGAGSLQRRAGQPMSRMTRGTRGKGPAGGPGQGFGGPGGRGGLRPMGGPPATQERGAHKRIVKIESSVGLQTLAGRMGIKAHELLRKLITLGLTGVNINSNLDAETAKIVASEFGWDVEDVAVSEEQALVLAQGVAEDEVDESGREPRPPVVTVMGHVDHGKTSLLDRIRKTNVVSGEAGGITQHIGAYSVETAGGRITFLDTPGHAAFTSMRARGAQTTDVVILVVAADDGVMPQTKEALAHARSANVPVVVAVNKCDKPEAQPDRVRRELSELGLQPEEWGGETLYADVSAQTGSGVDQLLEKVLLQAEMLDLRANPDKPAVGVVLEAELDRGRGPVATLLVTDGTLNRGDILLLGAACGKVRAMRDSLGRNVGSAGPSMPVEVIGLTEVPAAGDPVHVLKDMKKAQEIADSRKTKERRSLMPMGGPRLTLEELYKAMKDTEQLELKVIVKADVHGSVEAVSEALTRLSTDKVKVTVVHSAAGAITEGDVNLAVAAGAIIIGFNVRPAGKAAALAQQEKIEVRQYNIIYNVVDDVKAAMEGLLAPSLVEKVLGRVEVRQVFRISKAGNVAGCMVIEGLVRRSGTLRLIRENATVWQGKMTTLKRFKDDVREVKEGFDCGISLDGHQDVREGDILECFEVEEVRQTL